jgi:hypothetical protein
MPSLSTQPHKFFERMLDNDLDKLSKYLELQYRLIQTGKIIKGDLSTDHFKSSGSISTMNFYQYNAFQFYNESIYNLFKAVTDMVKEACEYYDIDFEAQKYYTQAWFNINHSGKGKLDWHDHSYDDSSGAPMFHGYYSVSAEPSTTYYKVFDKELKSNHNVNNRAILSEMGHPHAMGDWDWQGPRITIAYDISPLSRLPKVLEQHWVPLI